MSLGFSFCYVIILLNLQPFGVFADLIGLANVSSTVMALFLQHIAARDHHGTQQGSSCVDWGNYHQLRINFDASKEYIDNWLKVAYYLLFFYSILLISDFVVCSCFQDLLVRWGSLIHGLKHQMDLRPSTGTLIICFKR